MEFRSILPIEPSKASIRHDHTLVCLGSCFAEEIGKRLQDHLFPCCINPLGTVFNPLAIARLIERCAHGGPFTAEDFFRKDELWRSFHIQSHLARKTIEAAIDAANLALTELRSALLACDRLFLTLGTAWSYYRKEDAQDVTHNHSLPQNEFEKRLLSTTEVVENLSQAIAHLQRSNPRIHIVLTVSPVRHLRDGIQENNLSKATLLLACHTLLESLSQSSYFPAYELLLDDLRDYRFYKADLAHPNSLAIDYIWERFEQTFLSEESRQLNREIEAASRLASHRPTHKETNARRKSLRLLASQLDSLESRGLDVSPIRQQAANERT